MPLKSVLKWVLFAAVLPILVLVVGQSIYERMNSTAGIEYRVVSVEKLFVCPQGLEDRVTLTLDGKPHKNIGMLSISLFNRTAHAFGDVPVEIRLRGNTVPIAKMMLYPSEQDSEHFAWEKPDVGDLHFTARAMNTTWGAAAVVSFSLFFDGDNVPTVSLSTTKPGIIFMPFDDTKLLLFRYDFIVTSLVFCWFCVAAGIGIGKYASSKATRRLGAYARVFAKLYKDEVDRSAEISVMSAKQLSAVNIISAGLVAHLATNRRVLCGADRDKKVVDYANKLLAKIKEAAAKPTSAVAQVAEN